MTANRQEVSDQTTQPNETIDEPFHIASEAEFRQQLDDKLKNNPEFPSGLRSQDLPHDFSEQLGHDLDRNLRVANTAVREDALEETGHAFVKDLDKEIKDRSKVDFSSIIADLEKRIEEAGNEKVREALAIELGMYQGLETRNIETIKLYEDAKQAYREQQAKNARKKAEFQASHERLSQIRSAIEELSQANKSSFPDARDAHISLAHATSEIKTASQIRDEQETTLKSNNEFDPEEEEILSDEHVAKMNDFQTAEFLLKEAQQAFAEAQTRYDEIFGIVNENLKQITQLQVEAKRLEDALVDNYLDNSSVRIAKLQNQLRSKGVNTGPGPEVTKEEIEKHQQLHVSPDSNLGLEAEGTGKPESLATTQPASQAPAEPVLPPDQGLSNSLDELGNSSIADTQAEPATEPDIIPDDSTTTLKTPQEGDINDEAADLEDTDIPDWLQDFANSQGKNSEGTGDAVSAENPDNNTFLEPPPSLDDTQPNHTTELGISGVIQEGVDLSQEPLPLDPESRELDLLYEKIKYRFYLKQPKNVIRALITKRIDEFEKNGYIFDTETGAITSEFLQKILDYEDQGIIVPYSEEFDLALDAAIKSFLKSTQNNITPEEALISRINGEGEPDRDEAFAVAPIPNNNEENLNLLSRLRNLFTIDQDRVDEEREMAQGTTETLDFLDQVRSEALLNGEIKSLKKIFKEDGPFSLEKRKERRKLKKVRNMVLRIQDRLIRNLKRLAKNSQPSLFDKDVEIPTITYDGNFQLTTITLAKDDALDDKLKTLREINDNLRQLFDTAKASNQKADANAREPAEIETQSFDDYGILGEGEDPVSTTPTASYQSFLTEEERDAQAAEDRRQGDAKRLIDDANRELIVNPVGAFNKLKYAYQLAPENPAIYASMKNLMKRQSDGYVRDEMQKWLLKNYPTAIDDLT